jgi:hypothetical protein
MRLLQDDIVKFVSEPASPPRLVGIPEEGKAKRKSAAESVKVTIPLSLKTHRMKMMRRCFKSGSSYGQGSAAWTTQCSSHPRSAD